MIYFSLTYLLFFLEMHVSFVHYVVILPYFSSLLRITPFKTLCEKIQVCPAFINIIIENKQSHKSGAKATLYNVAMKVFLFILHIFICTCPFFPALT